MANIQEQWKHYEGLKAGLSLANITADMIKKGQVILKGPEIIYPSGKVSLTPDEYCSLALDALKKSIREKGKEYGVVYPED